MSHKSKLCLREQAKERFNSCACFGRSKYEDKQSAGRAYDIDPSARLHGTRQEYINAALRDRIYSYGTYRSYAKHNNYFFDWIEKSHPECKTLAQARTYAPEWIQLRVSQGLSPYTLALERSALSKLYGEPAEAFGDIPQRKMEQITRSRGAVERDKGFSETSNAEIIAFCRSTGLRRSELATLRPEALRCLDKDKGYYYLVIKGKGGRVREAPIIGSVSAVVHRIQQTAPGALVWDHVPSHMDVHSYRAEYATAIYSMTARDVHTLPRSEVYYCRGERKGKAFDKRAMLYASKALGHSRISVVGEHYIRL